MLTQNYLEGLSYKVIGCILEVHTYLGPGLLESVYHACLVQELLNRNIGNLNKIHVPVIYKNENLGGKLQLDILVENSLVIELKSVEAMIPLYKAQLITYLKLSGRHKGLLVNFNCERIKDQIVSLVTPSFFDLPRI